MSLDSRVEGFEGSSSRIKNTVSPGRTEDIVVLADNPGFWALHDHDPNHTTNNGVYPGGAMTHVAYEGYTGSYSPMVSLDE